MSTTRFDRTCRQHALTEHVQHPAHSLKFSLRFRLTKWWNSDDSTLWQNMSNTPRVVQGSRYRTRFRFLPIREASVKKDGKAIEILDQPLPYPRLVSISYLGSCRETKFLKSVPWYVYYRKSLWRGLLRINIPTQPTYLKLRLGLRSFDTARCVSHATSHVPCPARLGFRV